MTGVYIWDLPAWPLDVNLGHRCFLAASKFSSSPILMPSHRLLRPRRCRQVATCQHLLLESLRRARYRDTLSPTVKQYLSSLSAAKQGGTCLEGPPRVPLRGCPVAMLLSSRARDNQSCYKIKNRALTVSCTSQWGATCEPFVFCCPYPQGRLERGKQGKQPRASEDAKPTPR